MDKNIFILLFFRLIYWTLWLTFVLVLIKWSNNYNHLWLVLIPIITTPYISHEEHEKKDESDITNID